MNEEIEIGISDVRRLVETVKTKHNYDLSNLALTSFKRRIAKTIVATESGNIDELIHRLEKDANFIQIFLKNITVETTELFRDPAFWRYMRDKIIPTIKNTLPVINIWIADCSSGEEVFNVAILAHEANITDKIRITATDINEEVLNMAKSGVFPQSKLELSAENYKRFNEKGNFSDYYKLDKNNFIIDKCFLNNVTFQVHDISQCQPLKGFNFIICRNRLIYFNSNLHDSIITTFHKSLQLNGYLVIGHKETLSWCRDGRKFAVENDNEKVFRKVEV